MKDILVVAINPRLMKSIQECLFEENITRVDSFCCQNLNDLLHFMQKNLANITEVLVTTPGPSLYISRVAQLNIPIISIEYNNIDIIASLNEALTLSPEQVALGHYLEKNPRTDDIKKIVNKKFDNFIFGDNDENNDAILKKLNRQGINTIVGGGYICTRALNLGMGAVQFGLNKLTIKKSLYNALSIADARKFSRHSQSQTDIILNNQAEAVITVNKDNEITFFNKSAENIFSTSSEQALGLKSLKIFSENQFASVLKSKKPVKNHLHSIHGTDIVGHYIPVFDHSYIIGVVGTFSTIKEIQNKDECIRRYYYPKSDKAKYHFKNFYYDGPLFNRLLKRAEYFARTDETILITGESGTGKEIMAGSIHNAGKRKAKPFIAINCAAIPGSLMESELFGYEPGSFTGGQKNGRPGMFEFAHGGTLFLDEIGEMPLEMQSKLLRVLQEKEVRRIGAVRTIPIDVRIIAATNRNIPAEILKNRFRADLYYRLNVLHLHMPALRDYLDGMEKIAEKMLERIHPQLDTKDFSELRKILDQSKIYDWPGNLRELENVVRRFAALHSCLDRRLTYQDIFDDIPQAGGEEKKAASDSEIHSENAQNRERQKILDTYYKYHCNKTIVAQKLGISRSTLWRKLKRIQES